MWRLLVSPQTKYVAFTSLGPNFHRHQMKEWALMLSKAFRSTHVLRFSNHVLYCSADWKASPSCRNPVHLLLWGHLSLYNVLQVLTCPVESLNKSIKTKTTLKMYQGICNGNKTNSHHHSSQHLLELDPEHGTIPSTSGMQRTPHITLTGQVLLGAPFYSRGKLRKSNLSSSNWWSYAFDLYTKHTKANVRRTQKSHLCRLLRYK